MSQEIISLKLVSGEELLGKIIEETETELVLGDVLGLIAQNTPQGMQIGLGPFMMSNPVGDLRIQRNSIVVKTTPGAQLQTGYLEQTSKIDLSSKLPG